MQPFARSRNPFCQRIWFSLLSVLILFCGSGASCCRQLWYPLQTYGPPAPQVLSATATLDEVIAAVHANTDRIQSYATHNASIQVQGTPGMPSLSGNIALTRPGLFRLQAGTALLGQEIDLGSNQDLYWIWIKRSQPRAAYVGRHDLYGQSEARRIMPMDPGWLPSALGLVQFDPAGQHEGPIPRSDGRLEIRSTESSAAGPVTKVTVVDATRAWVLEQHVYDRSGTLLASAIAKSHRYFPVEQVSLPQQVDIHLPPAQLALSIDVGTILINQTAGDPNQLFGLPQFDDPVISLDPAGGLPQQPVPGTPTPIQSGLGPEPSAGAWVSMGGPADPYRIPYGKSPP